MQRALLNLTATMDEVVRCWLVTVFAVRIQPALHATCILSVLDSGFGCVMFFQSVRSVCWCGFSVVCIVCSQKLDMSRLQWAGIPSMEGACTYTHRVGDNIALVGFLPGSDSSEEERKSVARVSAGVAAFLFWIIPGWLVMINVLSCYFQLAHIQSFIHSSFSFNFTYMQVHGYTVIMQRSL